MQNNAINAVIATAYYITVMREMWMKPVPDGDVSEIVVPASIKAALAITFVAMLVFGIFAGITGYGAMTDLANAFGG